ncbi:MAG: ribosomal RNA small subunit methyltransferase A [Planctomycetales bacterium]|nr:ribosomal RNA small subunit methyltransferase A [Planctomycetales bacterium]
MKNADRQTRAHLMDLFEQHGFHPSTSLGQNFLIDLNLIDYLVTQADLGRDDIVLEIGTGTGGLTAAMAGQAGEVVSVEVDRRVHELAQEACAGLTNVTLLLTDALKNKNRFSPVVLDCLADKLAADPGRRLKLVANLPYCIATPVVSNLVASGLPWELMIVTIQRELAMRMRAKPDSEFYGAISVWLQSQCAVRVMKKLGPKVFWPRPRVESAIVRLLPDPERRQQIDDRVFFHDFIRRLFTQRRKRIRSVLVGMYRKEVEKAAIDEAMSQVKIAEGVRAEELDVATLVALGNAVGKFVREN